MMPSDASSLSAAVASVTDVSHIHAIDVQGQGGVLHVLSTKVSSTTHVGVVLPCPSYRSMVWPPLIDIGDGKSQFKGELMFSHTPFVAVRSQLLSVASVRVMSVSKVTVVEPPVEDASVTTRGVSSGSARHGGARVMTQLS